MSDVDQTLSVMTHNLNMFLLTASSSSSLCRRLGFTSTHEMTSTTMPVTYDFKRPTDVINIVSRFFSVLSSCSQAGVALDFPFAWYLCLL